MADISFPFMNAYGLIGNILAKIKQAKEPQRFTLDFLGTQLGFSGGSAKAFVPFAKKIGFLGSDGIPTELYKKFRNSNAKISGKAVADAIKIGYQELFDRNEYAYSLNSKDLKGLIMEITGLEENNQILNRICKSFEGLKQLADFEIDDIADSDINLQQSSSKTDIQSQIPSEHLQSAKGYKMNLSYTINLNLPKTDDINVFNAIFKSLKENLLK